MNEFLKLNWKYTSDPSYLEKQACSFISNEVLLDSYIYQNLKKRLAKPKALPSQTKEVNFFPGKKYLPKCTRKSSLTKEQQEHCLKSLILLGQNKNSNQLKQSEIHSLEVFDKLKAKITSENQEFIEFSKNEWERNKMKIAKLQNNLYRYGYTCFRKKFERYLQYGPFINSRV
ncbi:hypothetical protein HHI36_007698 [Cryptolaemus montrouzieri]|uniref:Uncharacterized protein n=1 Tax=Cryptolaemus montrouzieri TaxID=559131 RepID=A0ABD2MQD2_9CUCU